MKIFKLALCENHFEAKEFMNPLDKGQPKPRKNLRKDAIPTLFDIPNAPKTTTPRSTQNSTNKRPSTTTHFRQSKKTKGPCLL